MDHDSPNDTGRETAGATATSSPPASTDLAAPPSPLSGGLGVVVALVLLSTAAYLTYRTLYTAEQVPLDPPPIMYICAETLKTFQHTPPVGEMNPIESPYTKKNTAYPAEKCYWTADGRQKLIPTYILLNEHIGVDKATICPDCKRLVTHHNPTPPLGTPIVDSAEMSSRKGASTSKPAAEKS